MKDGGDCFRLADCGNRYCEADNVDFVADEEDVIRLVSFPQSYEEDCEQIVWPLFLSKDDLRTRGLSVERKKFYATHTDFCNVIKQFSKELPKPRLAEEAFVFRAGTLRNGGQSEILICPSPLDNDPSHADVYCHKDAFKSRWNEMRNIIIQALGNKKSILDIFNPAVSSPSKI